jgi:hypothetical protein
VAAKKDAKKAKAKTRVSAYTETIGTRICELIAESHTIDQVVAQLAADGTPISRRVIFKWLDAHPDFANMYAKAHQMQADHDADQIREIMRRVIDPTVPAKMRLDHNAARLAIDALKWAASKRNPKRYGDKLEVDTPADGGIAQAAAVTMGMLAQLAERKS